MSSSVGMMKFPIYGKIKNVPNHQPDNISMTLSNYIVVSHLYHVRVDLTYISYLPYYPAPHNHQNLPGS